jgi:hypothetical protein
MKKLFSLLLIPLLLVGCQTTPEKPPVVQKDMEQMMEAAKKGGEDTVILKALEVPDKYQKDLTSAKGNVSVHADAALVMPAADKIPTAAVDKQVFSQDTADRLMELLLQGQKLYDMKGYTQWTKADIQKKLVDLYAMRAGTKPVEVDGDLGESISTWEKRLQVAPEEKIKTPAETAFHKKDLSNYQSDKPLEPYDYIEGMAEIGGEPAYFLVQNWTQQNQIYAQFYRNWDERPHYEPESAFLGKLPADVSKARPKIAPGDAEKQADALVEKLGLSYMVRAKTELGINLEGTKVLKAGEEPDYAELKAAYIVRYVREVQGVPVTYTGDTGTHSEDEEVYEKPWAYEAVYVVIDDRGIVEFRWTSPYTDPRIVTNDASLLPFSEIQNVFEKMVLVKHGYYEEGKLELNIDQVQLGLMRVTNPNKRDSGLLIPVWDFFGGITYYPKKGEPYPFSGGGTSLLTVNAVDGSVIDRGLGY